MALNSDIVNDEDWLSFVLRQADIMADLDKAFPVAEKSTASGGLIAVVDRVIVAIPNHSGLSASQALGEALTEMRAGFADIQAAESRYRGRLEVWMAQTMLSWTAMAALWVKSLASPRARAQYAKLREMIEGDEEDPQDARREFLLAHADADERILEAASVASAWLIQALAALRLAGLDNPFNKPSEALRAAVRTFEVAIARKFDMRHIIDARIAGLTHREVVEAYPVETYARHPMLTWPALLGASDLPAAVDSPVVVAAAAYADGLDWNGGNEAIVDFPECSMRMPLTQAGVDTLRGFFKHYRGFRSIRGRDDTIPLVYPEAPNVELLRITRKVFRGSPDGYSLSIRIRHVPINQRKSKAELLTKKLAAV